MNRSSKRIPVVSIDSESIEENRYRLHRPVRDKGGNEEEIYAIPMFCTPTYGGTLTKTPKYGEVQERIRTNLK